MSSPNIRARKGLHHCVVRDRTIFLDPDANRYFALPERLDRAFRAVLNHPSGLETDQCAVRRLEQLNILENRLEAEDGMPGPSLPLPDHSLLEAPPSACGLMGVGEFLARYVATLAETRVRTMGALLRRRSMDASRRQSSADGRRAAYRVLAAARSIDSLVSPHRRCLPRSLAMFDAMNARGFRPNLVIGIGQMNFSAHCWLQDGNVVINDHVDTVRLYTPILIV